MHYEVESDRQCAGSCSGETHRVVRVTALYPGAPLCALMLDGDLDTRAGMAVRKIVAVFRRRDMAEDLCGEFNKPRGFVGSAMELLAAA